MLEHCVKGIRRKTLYPSARDPAELGELMIRKQFNIATSLAERRFDDAQYAKAMIEVFAKPSIGYGRFKINMCCRNNPYVNIHCLKPSEALDLAFLQKPQKARLTVSREVADLIKK
jgi:hypothetical protein